MTQLTKYTHATVVLAMDAGSVVIDPGAFTPNSAQLIANATAVLITHDHPDHFDADTLNAALAAQPDVRVWAPKSVVRALDAADGRVTSVQAGDTINVAGFSIRVVGEDHAPIHRDVPVPKNVGYVIDESIYHPGDSYVVPAGHIDVLLLPTSGPWAKLDEAVDFARAVGAGRVIQIHDLMLSDAGRAFFAQTIGSLVGTDVETLEPGTTITV